MAMRTTAADVISAVTVLNGPEAAKPPQACTWPSRRRFLTPAVRPRSAREAELRISWHGRASTSCCFAGSDLQVDAITVGNIQCAHPGQVGTRCGLALAIVAALDPPRDEDELSGLLLVRRSKLAKGRVALD